jgi:Fe2+ transport system protein B
MRKLSILVVLALLCGGFASISSKVKETGEHMKERAQDILATTKDKAHAAKDYMSAKAFETKADVREAFHGAKESTSSAKDSLKEKAKAGKDSASSKLHEVKADVKDTASKVKEGAKKMAQEANAKLRTGVSSITLVLLSLIFGVLFFMSFGQGAGVDKMKGKFFEARGKAKGAIDSTVNRAKAGYYDAKAKARESANREH